VAWALPIPPGAVVASGATPPTGPAYSIVLILHVVCAVVGFGAVATTGVQAWRARGGLDSPSAESVRRYFKPGVNWAARLLYGVPLFGFLLLALSHGTFDTADGWVTAGLLLWLVAAGVAELVVWPGERDIQRSLADAPPTGAPGPGLVRTCRHVAAGAGLLAVVFLAATVLMVGKP
jgi:uncharacterized membrane protein